MNSGTAIATATQGVTLQAEQINPWLPTPPRDTSWLDAAPAASPDQASLGLSDLLNG